MPGSDRVAVLGVGTSHFGRQPELDAVELGWRAVREALVDADVTDIDSVWVGTVFGAPGVAQRILRAMGITGVPVVTVENACASGTTAFVEGAEAVRSGRYERVLVLGVEQMNAGAIAPEPTDPEGRAGLALPALYAMAAQRYLHNGAATVDQLAAVAVKNKAHGLANPRAPYGGDLTAMDVLGSRMIADPLTLLQCCSPSDGAAAAVLAPARNNRRGVPIRGITLRSGGTWDQRSTHVWGFDLVEETSARALHTADVDPADLDVLEVHDAFTIGELVTVEAIGLVAPGCGGTATVEGHTALGGRQPVNPSGGLLSRGHPLGATGLAQVAEIVTHLRGRGGTRQVDGARLGLVETMGGGVSGIDGNACVVAVLEAP